MKKIKIILLMLLLAAHVSSEVFIYDNYTKEQREEKIAAKIRKCKNVVNVIVRDDNEESTCADVFIELTNNRTIHLKNVDLKLKGYNAAIENVDDIFPIGWGYETSVSSKTVFHYELGIRRITFSELKYLMGKESWNICSIINHYDELYNFLKSLPDWNRNMQHGRFDVSKDSMVEPICPLWERYDNPFSVKGKQGSCETLYGYKFFKANEKTFNNPYNDSDSYNEALHRQQHIDIN